MDETSGSEFGVKHVKAHPISLGHVVVVQISKEVGEALSRSDDAILKDYTLAPTATLERLASQYWQRIGQTSHPTL